MDLQKMLDNAAKASRLDSMATSAQMTVGEAIAVLEHSELTYESEGKEHDKYVGFQFEYVYPTGLASWRGSYAELAISFDWSDRNSESEKPTAKEFLGWLKDSIGETYYGYKGGEFVMGKNTPLWVANYGNAGATGPKGNGKKFL